MIRRRKIVLFFIALLLVAVIIAGLVNIREWFHYVYPNYYPSYVDAFLLTKIGVIEEEILEEADLEAFSQNFEGIFNGYYDKMPESLKILTDEFVFRINQKYPIELSPSEVEVYAFSGDIDFMFKSQGLIYIYYYRDMKFNLKIVRYLFPRKMYTLPLGEDSSGQPISSNWYSMRVGIVDFVNNLSTITQCMTTYDPGYTKIINSISTSDYDKFMKAAIGGEVKIDDSLSIDSIKKHVRRLKNK